MADLTSDLLNFAFCFSQLLRAPNWLQIRQSFFCIFVALIRCFSVPFRRLTKIFFYPLTIFIHGAKVCSSSQGSGCSVQHTNALRSSQPSSHCSPRWVKVIRPPLPTRRKGKSLAGASSAPSVSLKVEPSALPRYGRNRLSADCFWFRSLTCAVIEQHATLAKSLIEHYRSIRKTRIGRSMMRDILHITCAAIFSVSFAGGKSRSCCARSSR